MAKNTSTIEILVERKSKKASFKYSIHSASIFIFENKPKISIFFIFIFLINKSKINILIYNILKI